MLSAMNALNKKLGIFGYWIISNEGKITYKNVPGAYVVTDLVESSILIIDVFNMLEEKNRNVSWMEFSFSLYKILIRRSRLGMVISLCIKDAPFSEIMEEMNLISDDVDRMIAGDSLRDRFQKELDSNLVKTEFFSIMQRSLADEIGPVAQLLINEKIKEMGLTTKNFPRNRVLELLDKVSLIKEDVGGRRGFKRDMMLALRLL